MSYSIITYANNTLRKLFRFNVYQRDEWVRSIAGSILPGARILDVGAGGAPYRELFSKATYQTQDFCQLRDDQLRFKAGYVKIDYVCDIVSIPLPAESFDAVLCTEVLEHVPEPTLALKEMIRLVKPGGHLFISAPLGSGLHQIPFHYYGGFTPYWYRRFAVQFGCEVRSIEANGGYQRFHAQEALRFCIRSLPWNSEGGVFVRSSLLLLLPFSSFVALIAAIVGYWQNTQEINPDFTVGYHVVLEKKVTQ